MTKNYNLLAAFTFLCSSIVFDAGAQLSGVYTINSANPTGGTNFANFTDFASAYNTQGLGGPVTVNVATGSGPYVEQVNFIQTAGTSSSNKVVINGNGNLITFNSTSSATPWTIRLEGADNMAFNNLNIEGTGSSAYALLMWNGASNNTFSNCSFSVSISGSSTLQMPVVLSGSGSSYSSMGNSGNNNLWQSCIMSGGYYGISMYGSSSAPYNTNNQVIDCSILDWYSRGISHYYYQTNYVLKDNFISRPNRTNSTTAYGIYSYYNEGTLIEGNRIQGCFNAMPGSSSSMYGIYMYWNLNSAPKGNPNIVRNNIIADMKNNGTSYGLAAMYIDGYVYHNTISLDYTGATSGSAYGLYTYATTNKEVDIKNNIVSITKGGNSTKYGIYYVITGYVTSDYNDIYVNAGGGVAGYYNGSQTSLANLQTASGQDQNSVSLDPMYISIAANNYEPTNTNLNNLGTPLGVLMDIEYGVRNQTTPDMGALEFLTPACNGAPAVSTINGPNYAICPGEDVYMVLGNLIAQSGFTYQWQSSTISNVGPFTPIAGANMLMYTAPSVTQTTYFSLVMTCTNPGGGTSSPVATVQVAGPTVGSVPYYEDFEGIGISGRLPNCSWAATGLGSSNLTYVGAQSNNRVPLSGNSFASFSNSSPGTSNFFTHPIQMNVGITYSAAVNYATEYFGYNNWTNLSIWVGPNQNPTGMVQVASISPAMSGSYKLLDGTFTVPSSGLYYVAIRATSSTGNALYLSIDDLSITIPCDPASPNTPTLGMSISNQTICAGDIINLTAIGADTYSWNVGATSSTFSDSPQASTNYIVYGTNTLTGCTATMMQSVLVNPGPNVVVIANPPVVCSGQPAALTALGAVSYAWSNNQSGSNITVNPTSTTAYTVMGMGANGCSSNYVVNITVRNLPNVSAVSSSNDACKDDMLTLTASGGTSYMWYNSVDPSIYVGSPINVNVSATSVFTVVGTDQNGCSNKYTVALNISECTGLTEYTGNRFTVSPNPTNGMVTLNFGNAAERQVTISDLTGRIVKSFNVSSESNTINLDQLNKGLYLVTVVSEKDSQVVRLVKD